MARGPAGWRWTLPRAAHTPELLDGPAPASEVARCLADVARLNRMGGRGLTLSRARRLLATLPPDRPAVVLDVGTGGADLPRALVRWARRAGRPLRVLALDRDRRMLAFARGAVAGHSEVALLEGDALALPLPDRSVDVAMSALVLHHLEPPAAALHLAELARVARHGVIVNDLARSRLGYALVWLATRVLARSRMAWHDGPLSVRRAYTLAEVRDLFTRAGLGGVHVRHHPTRARLLAWRDGAAAGRP